MYRNKKTSANPQLFFLVAAALACIIILVGIIASGGKLFQPAREHPLPPPVTDPLPSDTTEPITDPAPDTTVPDETEAPDVPDADTPAEPPATEQTEPAETEPIILPATGDYVLGETADAGIEYQDKIIFLGDSTTYSLLYYGKLSGGKESPQVWTPKSRTLALDLALTTTILYPDTEEEISIEEAARRKQPEIMVITLGVNGVSYMHDKEDYFISVYTKLVNKIKNASPDTKIILQSIYPVARNWEKTKSINNERIRAANGWVQQVAEDCGIYYLDTISVLADEEGYLPEAYQNGDGIHLNANSCGIVLDYIRTHALPGYTEE